MGHPISSNHDSENIMNTGNSTNTNSNVRFKVDP